jgi:uncharacterized ion transporter superfamily protein YfcC
MKRPGATRLLDLLAALSHRTDSGGFGWYIIEMSALFVALGILMGAIGGLGANGVARAFMDGVRDLAPTAMIIGLVGVTRQTAVLAFQMGDGFTNMIIPTNAVLMGVLTLAGIPWPSWARWILPLQISLFALGVLALAVAVYVGYGT